MSNFVRKRELVMRRAQIAISVVLALLLSGLGSLVIRDIPLLADSHASSMESFLLRLAFTLPVVALAIWLTLRQRTVSSRAFVDGFAGFAGILFFFELLPYIPRFGGYLWYAIGIGGTVVLGKVCLTQMSRYLERLKEREEQGASAAHRAHDYDSALTKLAAGACPSCERQIKVDTVCFCPHCAQGINYNCQCGERSSVFTRFCSACGTTNSAQVPADKA